MQISRPQFFAAFALLFCLNLNAQNPKIDSIRDILVSKQPGSEAYLQELFQLQRHFSLAELNDSSLIYGLRAEALAKKLGKLELLADIYTRLGLISQYRGRFQMANDYGFKAIKLKDSLQLGPISLAESHGNIALSFQELGQFAKALEHQQLSQRYFQEGGDSSRAAMRIYMIGGLLYEMGRYDSAKVYYDRALDYYKALGQEAFIAIYHTYIGLIYLKQDKLNDAEAEFLYSLARYPEDGAKRSKVFIYTNLGVVNLVMGAERDSIGTKQLNKAVNYARQSYQLAKELSFLGQMRKAHEVLYKSFNALGLNDSAMVHAKAYIDLSDSLYSVEQQATISEMQTKYETGKKDAEIDFLSRENDLNAENLRQKEALVQSQLNIIYILSAAALIIILFGLNSYRLYRQRQKAILDLKSTNTVISRQFEEREMLLKEIHHRVKNNLQVISSLLDLQSSSITDPQALVAVEDGQSRVKAMALIHQELYQNEDLSVIDINDFIKKLVEQNGELQGEMADYEFHLPEGKLMLDIDTAVPLGLILNELVTNAYKYGKSADGKLRLELKLEVFASEYRLNFKDSGPGLAPNLDWEKSRSLGLRLIKRLSRQLYGKVEYEYQEGANFSLFFKDTKQRKEIA